MSKSQTSNLPTRTASTSIIDDILGILEKVEYGDATFQVKRNQGKNHSLIVSYFDHVRYPDNVRAGGAIMQVLAGLAEKDYEGAYTFTVNFKSGNIKEVIYEGLEQIRYGQ